MDDRRDVRRGNGWVEAACVYYFASWSIASSPISRTIAESAATSGGRARARGRDAADAGDDRHARRPNVAGRLGYAAIAFGSWDILYYVFLRIISGWPASLFDWDILFLLPLPWWGPVLAPVCIASLMIVWGTLVTQRQDRIPATRFTRASVACELGRPSCSRWGIHGRFDSRPCRRARRGSSGAADGFQLPVFARRSCSWPRRWRTLAGDRLSSRREVRTREPQTP